MTDRPKSRVACIVAGVRRAAFVTVFGLHLAVAPFWTAGCSGASLPRPPFTQVLTADYVPVPFPPRAPQVEIVPDSPRPDAVWVDGSWTWDGERYRWVTGGWVIAPPGAKLARWVLVRRPFDGQLFFAPSTWRDESGKTVTPPELLSRARAREGQAPGELEAP